MPRTQRILGLVPEVGAAQEVGAAGRIVDHGIGRVGDPLQARAGDGLDHRGPVVEDQDGAPGREDDARGRVVQIGHAGPFLLGRGEPGLQLLERLGEVPARGLALDLRLVALGLGGGDAGEPHLGDVEGAGGDGAAVPVDLDVLGEPQHAEAGFGAAAALEREGRPAAEHVAVQGLGLRFVDDEGTARGVERARPVGGVGVGGGGEPHEQSQGQGGHRPRRGGA